MYSRNVQIIIASENPWVQLSEPFEASAPSAAEWQEGMGTCGVGVGVGTGGGSSSSSSADGDGDVDMKDASQR